MTGPLGARIKRLMDRADALSLRERALVFAAIMAVLFFCAWTFLFEPLAAAQKRLEAELQAKQTQAAALNVQTQKILEAYAQDPDADNRARRAELNAQLRSADASVSELTRGLVSPPEMARLVERALASKQVLQVVKVENVTGAPLTVADGQTASGLYRHGLRIQVRGRYADMLEYLRALEALPWRVFWAEASLKVEVYPVASLTLVVYTLSRQKGWIGT